MWRKGETKFFPKLRIHINDNNNSPHGKFHRFLFPFSSKFPDLNFAPYVLYIYSCYETRTWHKQWAFVTCGHTLKVIIIIIIIIIINIIIYTHMRPNLNSATGNFTIINGNRNEAGVDQYWSFRSMVRSIQSIVRLFHKIVSSFHKKVSLFHIYYIYFLMCKWSEYRVAIGA